MLAEVDPSRLALALHLWNAIPPNGAPISNRALQKRTKTASNSGYRPARNALRDAGLVTFGGGLTGSVRRDERFVDADAHPAVDGAGGFELTLYPAIVARLEERIAEEARFDAPPVVRVTGMQGRKQTGGVWTRPDITVVAHKKFRVLVGGHLEVHTYEVKTGAAFNLTALHEARAHRRRAHRSYVLVDYDNEADVGKVESLIDEARELGVGLIGFHSVQDEWRIWFEPPIHHPDPIELDTFLFTQLPNDVETIRAWAATPALGGTE